MPTCFVVFDQGEHDANRGSIEQGGNNDNAENANQISDTSEDVQKTWKHTFMHQKSTHCMKYICYVLKLIQENNPEHFNNFLDQTIVSHSTVNGAHLQYFIVLWCPDTYEMICLHKTNCVQPVSEHAYWC